MPSCCAVNLRCQPLRLSALRKKLFSKASMAASRLGLRPLLWRIHAATGRLQWAAGHRSCGQGETVTLAQSFCTGWGK